MKKAQLSKAAFLPVDFFGWGYLSSRDRVLAFWDYEKAKKAAIVERCRNLGRSRSSPAMTQKRPLESIFGPEAIWSSKTSNRRQWLSQAFLDES